MRSLRHKLWLAFGSLLSIVLTVSALSVVVLTRHTHAMERVFRENYNSAIYCDAMKASLDHLNTRAQELVWDESPGDRATAVRWESEFDANLAAQVGNCYLPGEREATRELAGLWGQYKLRYRLFDAAAAPDRVAAYRGDLLPRYVGLVGVAQRIADMNMLNMVSVDGQAKQTLVSARRAILVLVGCGTVLAALVVWAVVIKLLRPLNELTRSVHEVERGNLDLNLHEISGDEVGRLAAAFNSMTSRLREFKRIDHDRLVRTQQTTQLAIDSLPDAVFIIGPDGAIEIANEAAGAYFGIAPGRQLSELGLHWLPPLVERVGRDGRPIELHGYAAAVQIFVDGEERFLLPRVVPMLSPDRRPLGIAAILVDVTQLRHVDEAKSNLVSTVSHELKTPLTSQRLLLDLLLSGSAPAAPAKQRRMLEVVKADSDRLYRTIEHLLGLSRMESGRAQFKFGPTCPRDVVLAAVEPLRQLFADRPVRLVDDVPDRLPPVHADPVALNSALTNLLTNALKFTPAGGEVAVRCEAVGARVAFVVADTGPGIPPEYRGRIFEKFFRVPDSAGPSGAGLGLSICKNIVEAHGGTIGFTCPESGGTVFRLEIPVGAGVGAAPAGAGTLT